MRLDFNLLWVENQQDLVQSQKEKIERQIRSEGFRLQVKFVSSVDEAIKCLADDIYSDHVDLILMDYDLGSGKMGDEGLAEVRSRMPYRDIVFYSSKADDLLRMVLEKGVHGVYCSTRQELPDTSVGVFQAMVRKVLDIDHSRGIVMGTTSDIDHFVMDSLVASFEASSPEAKSKAIAQVKADLEQIRIRFEKSIGEASSIEHVSDLFDQYGIYTSVDRLELLRKILKEIPAYQAHDATLSGYIQKTVPKRNILAHVRVRVEENGFSRKLVDRKNVEHTSANMKELRLELLGHHEAFEALSQSLKTPQ